jgi:hypothetical protein
MLLRNQDGLKTVYLERLNLLEKIKITLLLAVLFGAIAITYSEALLLGIIFLVGLFLLDLISFNKHRMRCNLLLATGISLGLIFVFPISKELIRFTIDNSGNVGAIGYPQPSWMFPSEIMGVGSIYANIAKYLDTAVSTHVVIRTNIELIVGGFVSLMVAYAIYRGTYILRDISFVLTAVFGIMGFFVVNYWLSLRGYMPENYVYNKLSSILAVVLIGFTVIGTWSVDFKNEKLKRIGAHKIVLALLICAVCITSIFTLKDSRNYSTNIDLKSIDQLNRQLKGCNCALLSSERGRRGEKLIGQLRYVDRTADFFMATMFSVPILDQWDSINWHLFAGDEVSVYLILRKDYILPDLINPSRVVANSKTYLILNTLSTVGELKKKNGVELAGWINAELANK